MKLFLNDAATKKRAEIEAMIEKEQLYNCNIADTDFEIIENSDFTSIEDEDSIEAITILNNIYTIVTGKQWREE